MPDDVSSPPLLTLIKEQSLIDDLQYEEVLAEFKRTGKPIIQALQDFGLMELDDILHVMATYLGVDVVSFKDRPLTPELIKALPANMARMYQCVPVGMANGTLQVALVRPRKPARIYELPFACKNGAELGEADPPQIP